MGDVGVLVLLLLLLPAVDPVLKPAAQVSPHFERQGSVGDVVGELLRDLAIEYVFVLEPGSADRETGDVMTREKGLGWSQNLY